MKALLGQLSDMDIRLLRVFIAVVESGGVSAAEMELNISRSTISRHLKSLEARLGIVLCHRGRAGFSLTSEGEHIYASAVRLLISMEDFRQDVNDLHQSIKGQLVIAMFDMTVTNPACRVNEAIDSYIKKFPDISIEIHVVPVNEIEKGVIDGRYHIGIISPVRRSASLRYIPLFGEKMNLYCGEGHPLFDTSGSVSTQKIMAQRYAGLTFSSPNMEHGNALGLIKNAAASNQEGIATLILSGQYIGFLPEHFVRRMEPDGRFQKLENAKFSYDCEFTAIHRKSPKPTRVVQQFIEALSQVKER
ncbi:LysR family transcriptional regulator [Vibrio aerogenes]|nr:LysR family transcriptional regulator [Vibrio aerogenes]